MEQAVTCDPGHSGFRVPTIECARASRALELELMLGHLSKPVGGRKNGRSGFHEACEFLATDLFGRAVGAPPKPGEDVPADRRRRGQLLRTRTSGEPRVA